MSNLSLTELKLIAKNRDSKDYESMSEDKLLSVLNISVKTITVLSSTELKLIAKIRGIKRYENMSKDKLLSASNKSKPRKTIRKIKEENRDVDKMLRDLDFIFDPEKDYYEPKKTVSAFNNNYIQYDSMGDKEKSLSVKDVIRPYLSLKLYRK